MPHFYKNLSVFIFCFLKLVISTTTIAPQLFGNCTNSNDLDPANCTSDAFPSICKENQFRCANGNCIEMSELCDSQNDCLDNSDETEYCADEYQLAEPPNVTILGVSGTVFGIGSDLYMDYDEEISVKFVCEAHYPIEWLFNYEPVVGGAEFEKGNILERIVTEDGDLRYRNVLNVMYYTISGENVFYCRGIHNPGSQSMVTSLYYNNDMKQVQFQIKDKADKKIVSIFTTSYGDTNSECDVDFYYEAIEDYGVWRCIQPKTKAPGIVTVLKCENENMCNNYYRNNRLPKHCIKPFVKGATCLDCDHVKDTNRQGRIVECFHEEADLSQSSYTIQVFNALGIGDEDLSLQKIYSGLAEVPLEEMIFMPKLPEDIYVGESLSITCKATAYFYQPTIKIGLEYQDGSMQYITPSQEFRELRSHENEHITTYELQIANDTLSKIYCIGSSLRTMELSNASREVYIQVPEAPMLLVRGENFESENNTVEWDLELIEWDSGETGKSIHCNVSGKPLPNIAWIRDGIEIPAALLQRSDSWSFSQLNFSTVSETTAGIYDCGAANIASNHTKRFEIVVRENDTTASIVGGSLASGVILSAIVAAGVKIFRRKNKNQKSGIQVKA